MLGQSSREPLPEMHSIPGIWRSLGGSLRALSLIYPSLDELEVIGHHGKGTRRGAVPPVYEGRGRHSHLWGNRSLWEELTGSCLRFGTGTVVLSREVTPGACTCPVKLGGGVRVGAHLSREEHELGWEILTLGDCGMSRGARGSKWKDALHS